MILNKFSSFIKLYTNLINKTFLENDHLSRIENIDNVKNEVVFYVRGVISPIYLSFDNLIQDTDIISSLNPVESSLLGYYYGCYYYNFLKIRNNLVSDFNCFQNIPSHKHSIQMLDRNGNLIFLDPINSLQTTKSPSQIMMDKGLILKFTPLQSFYIGMLSGISESKNISKKLNIQTKSKLRLVK